MAASRRSSKDSRRARGRRRAWPLALLVAIALTAIAAPGRASEPPVVLPQAASADGLLGLAADGGIWDALWGLLFRGDAPASGPGPAVALSAPVAGATVSGRLSGDACRAVTADDAAVARVEFLVDGVSSNTEAVAPWNCDWDTTSVPDGAHTLTAKAFDADGDAGSASVEVVVANGPAPAADRPAFGLITGWRDSVHVEGIAALEPKLARHELHLGMPQAAVDQVFATYADRGVKVLPLAMWDDHQFDVPGQEQTIAAWAERYGPGGAFWADRDDGHLASTHIELFNETAYAYQSGEDQYEWGKRYAVAAAKAHDAVEAANPRVSVIAQQHESGEEAERWMRGLREAVPDLGERIKDWSIHPYGPQYMRRMADASRGLERAGWGDGHRLWVTEIGFASDDGRTLSDNYGWPTNMTYEDAGAALTRAVEEISEVPHLGGLIVYASQDYQPPGATSEREDYFGVLRKDNSPKGTYATAVKAILAR